MYVYQVCILHSNRNYFDYESEAVLSIGARVWAPFGPKNKQRLGIIVSQNPAQNPEVVLKKISAALDDKPLITPELFTLCLWVSNYYQSPLSEVLPLAVPKKYRLGGPCQIPMSDFYQLALPYEEAQLLISARAHKQLALLRFLGDQTQAVSKQELAHQGFNSSQLIPLVSAGAIALTQNTLLPKPGQATPSAPLDLNPEQALAVETISAHLHHFQCFLLQGVTGSGKTEVYLHLINKVLLAGKQVLVLVPEIGLTPQLLARFTARFNQPIAVMHSHLSETERQIAWQLAKEQAVQMLIGTRSSLFTPLPNLGLIIIDEEHDSSLKQMEGVRYSARDTALMRAHLANIPIILGSATPSLESVHNCTQNKYQLLSLQQKALSSTPLHYQLVDLRAQPLQQGFANPTLELINKHLQNHNQVLVFINRRGFAPILLCHQCGWMADCRACDSHLTLHRQAGQIICHHCGLAQNTPKQCHSCHSRELIPVGSGTQRIHEFLTQRFPQTNILRIDRDEMGKKNALTESLDKINQGEAQLIVGTQMLAKGHHFPQLSLVVILDADAGFYNQDFRAVEHLGQLLTQVSGRAGRAEQAGTVVIQTHLPDHPLLNLLIKQGYPEFAQALLASRQQAQLPPYHYLAVIRAQSTNTQSVLQFLLATKDHLKGQAIEALGPAPAPLARKNNQYRMQLLLKSPSRSLLNRLLTQLREWVTINKLTNNVRWNVDVDPMDLS